MVIVAIVVIVVIENQRWHQWVSDKVTYWAVLDSQKDQIGVFRGPSRYLPYYIHTGSPLPYKRTDSKKTPHNPQVFASPN